MSQPQKKNNKTTAKVVTGLIALAFFTFSIVFLMRTQEKIRNKNGQMVRNPHRQMNIALGIILLITAVGLVGYVWKNRNA